MYRAVVKHRIRSLFRQANEGNWAAIVDTLAPSFSYRFVGDTPLGGTRTTHAAMRLWFDRLYRLFPGAQFVPDTVVVQGPPWRTTVMTHVRIRGTAPDADGVRRPYENEFMQRMTLRWGRATSVVTLEDTQRFVDVLGRLRAAGVAEADAVPITDEDPITDAA